MSLVYKCDFYGTTTNNPDAYPHKRTVTIDVDDQDQPLTINGVVCELDLSIEMVVTETSDKIHVSGAAWKDAAQLLKNWLDATFP
jgi:hypothetical protein